MERFKMNFSNANYIPAPRQSVVTATNVSSKPVPTLSLRSPMIDRVYKAKPGCSACGKKVA
jgi:hypothetical protein